MMATAGDIVACINAFAPFETAEPWDNCGLLIGGKNRPVRKILCALDITPETLQSALRLQADTIVTHHPVMFRGRKNILEDDAEGKLLIQLIKNDICVIAAHTNFDCAEYGVNHALASKLALQDIVALEGGGRIGSIPQTLLWQFAQTAQAALGDAVRMYGDANSKVCKVAVMGGSGGGFAAEARAAGADVFVTGEIGYHVALNCVDMGMAVLEAGHRATESPSVSAMCGMLAKYCADMGFEIEPVMGD